LDPFSMKSYEEIRLVGLHAFTLVEDQEVFGCLFFQDEKRESVFNETGIEHVRLILSSLIQLAIKDDFQNAKVRKYLKYKFDGVKPVVFFHESYNRVLANNSATSLFALTKPNITPQEFKRMQENNNRSSQPKTLESKTVLETSTGRIEVVEYEIFVETKPVQAFDWKKRMMDIRDRRVNYAVFHAFVTMDASIEQILTHDEKCALHQSFSNHIKKVVPSVGTADDGFFLIEGSVDIRTIRRFDEQARAFIFPTLGNLKKDIQIRTGIIRFGMDVSVEADPMEMIDWMISAMKSSTALIVVDSIWIKEHLRRIELRNVTIRSLARQNNWRILPIVGSLDGLTIGSSIGFACELETSTLEGTIGKEESFKAHMGLLRYVHSALSLNEAESLLVLLEEVAWSDETFLSLMKQENAKSRKRPGSIVIGLKKGLLPTNVMMSRLKSIGKMGYGIAISITNGDLSSLGPLLETEKTTVLFDAREWDLAMKTNAGQLLFGAIASIVTDRDCQILFTNVDSNNKQRLPKGPKIAYRLEGNA